MEMDKGAEVLLQALSRMGKKVFGLFVGGTEKDVALYRNKARTLGVGESVKFVASVPRVEVPRALAACDILVYPAPATQDPYFNRDTSPLKLFQYFAAQRPVVCADLLPVRAIVDTSLVRFCPSGDPDALVQALEEVLSHPHEAQERVRQAYAFVQEHTWEKRMQRILGEA
jgi:glycosyltransferase involved in cell wall biosynthesis